MFCPGGYFIDSMHADRTILHCDLNGFYASVEALEHPEIGSKPMAVTGNVANRHGVILAKNEAAKRRGVTTGEPTARALAKCPNLILLDPHHEKYSRYSALVNEIYASFTDRVEPFGIDESWLDVSASKKLFGDGKTIADKLRKIIREKFKLTISVGVSFNKVFAKLASDYKKPDATTVFGRAEYGAIIRKLPVKDLLFAGPATADTLAGMGIFTIGQLADANDEAIFKALGKAGLMLLSYARGEDDSPVAYCGYEKPAKSVGNSTTFRRDLAGEGDVRLGLKMISEKVARRLKDKSLKCRCVQLTVKGADFSVLTRRALLKTPSNSMRELEDSSMRLFKKSWPKGKPVRMLGISASALLPANTPFQAELFDQTGLEISERKDRAECAFFDVRKKFGRDCIKFASLIDADLL